MNKMNNDRNNLDDEDDVNALVSFCLDEMGRPPPTPSFFHQMATRPPPQPTLDSIQDRLQKEKKLHSDELSKLYDFQAHQRDQLYREQRTNMDGGDYYPNPNIGAKGPNNERQVPIPRGDWEAVSTVYRQTLTFDDTIYRYNRAFIKSQQPLYRQLAELKEEQRRHEEERNFTLPTSMAEFDLITSRDHQNRVARFLQSEGKSGLPPFVKGTPEDVQALLSAYNSSFQFKKKVADLLASIQSTDPRRRRSTVDMS